MKSNWGRVSLCMCWITGSSLYIKTEKGNSIYINCVAYPSSDNLLLMAHTSSWQLFVEFSNKCCNRTRLVGRYEAYRPRHGEDGFSSDVAYVNRACDAYLSAWPGLGTIRHASLSQHFP